MDKRGFVNKKNWLKKTIKENYLPSPAQHEHHPIFRQKLTLGQKASDWLTRWVGSWTFILALFGYMFVWISLNLIGFIRHWDPWPFILLNLTLSCLAAAQAPIILMSQNRQTERDRLDARYDHAINRKAERENQQMMKDLAEIKKVLGIGEK